MALATCSCWAPQRRAQPLDMSEAHEVCGEPNGEPTETDARRRQATPSDYRCSSTAHQATSSDVRRRAGKCLLSSRPQVRILLGAPAEIPAQTLADSCGYDLHDACGRR